MTVASPVTSHPLWHIWSGMRDRCRNPNSKNFKYYGGRGISVCPRWESFANFASDMGSRPPGTSIDRIDCDGHYEPGNCRWATKAQQVANRKRRFAHKRSITWRGITRTSAEWAKQLGLTRRAIQMRLHHGWTLEQAMMTPNRSVTHTNVRPMK